MLSLNWHPLALITAVCLLSTHNCLAPPDGRHAKSICCILRCLALQERSRRYDVCRISGELACTWHAPLGRYMRLSTQVSLLSSILAGRLPSLLTRTSGDLHLPSAGCRYRVPGCACHPNSLQLGCRLIAWWLCRAPW